nr:tyrosine-type recombinase/integrase [Enterobacter sp. Bisph1]
MTFVKTKTGKPRTVRISDEVAQMVTCGKRGFLFPDAAYPHFRMTIKEIKPDLPMGQATHALRHSFATHFMINSGSIITLQRILGHSQNEQIMVYAHFAPEYLQDAISLNPLRGWTCGQECPHRVHRWVTKYGSQWSCVPRKPALYR